jgi:hypothetical protein
MANVDASKGLRIFFEPADLSVEPYNVDIQAEKDGYYYSHNHINLSIGPQSGLSSGRGIVSNMFLRAGNEYQHDRKQGCDKFLHDRLAEMFFFFQRTEAHVQCADPDTEKGPPQYGGPEYQSHGRIEGTAPESGIAFNTLTSGVK